MFAFLHTLSAVLFYALGSSVFLAYILLRKGLGAEIPAQWLQAIDLPLLLTGLLYGGISIYRSLRDDSSVSTVLMVAIGLPVVLIFLAVLALNFLPFAS